MGHEQGETLMTRYFAVRETVLGVGGLLAVLGGSPAAVRRWAGLGALTDVGDLAASLADLHRREKGALAQSLLAAAGLAVEARALARSPG